MGFLKRNWKKIAGVACGVAAPFLTAVNPVLGGAAVVACAAAFGASNVKVGQEIGEAVKKAADKKK